MKKWKISFSVCLILLVLSNCFWIYVVIDQAVSYTYLTDSFDHTTRSKKELGKLIVQGAEKYELSQKDILFLLRQVDPKSFIVEEGNSISTNYAKFTFNKSQLISVE